MQKKESANNDLMGLTEFEVHQIETEGKLQIGKIICGGKLYSDFTFVFIVIPLWFNIIKDYWVFTEKGILLIYKDLWSTPKSNFILYEQIECIILRETKSKKEIEIALKSGQSFKPRFNIASLKGTYGSQSETIMRFVKFKTEKN